MPTSLLLSGKFFAHPSLMKPPIMLEDGIAMAEQSITWNTLFGLDSRRSLI